MDDDLVAGRRMELEALHGLVVRRAAQHGVPVPMSEAIYAILISRPIAPDDLTSWLEQQTATPTPDPSRDGHRPTEPMPTHPG